MLYILNFYEAISCWEQVPFHRTQSANNNKIYHEKSVLLLRLRDYLANTDTQWQTIFNHSYSPSLSSSHLGEIGKDES